MQDTFPWANYVYDSKTNHSRISHLEQVFAVFSAVILYFIINQWLGGISTLPVNTISMGPYQKTIRYESIYKSLIFSK